MAEDFHSIHNSYAVDLDDPGVATMGYSAKDEKNLCRDFRLKRRCPRGDLCPYVHDPTKGAVISGKSEVFGVSDCEHVVSMPTVGSFVSIEITAIFTPNRFYAIFPYGPSPIKDVISKRKSGFDG